MTIIKSKEDVVGCQSLVAPHVSPLPSLPANAVVAGGERGKGDGGRRTNDLPDTEMLLQKLKNDAVFLNHLQEKGLINEKDIEDIKKELANAIKELEALNV